MLVKRAASGCQLLGGRLPGAAFSEIVRIWKRWALPRLYGFARLPAAPMTNGSELLDLHIEPGTVRNEIYDLKLRNRWCSPPLAPLNCHGVDGSMEMLEEAARRSRPDWCASPPPLVQSALQACQFAAAVLPLEDRQAACRTAGCFAPGAALAAPARTARLFPGIAVARSLDGATCGCMLSDCPARCAIGCRHQMLNISLDNYYQPHGTAGLDILWS